MEDRVSKAHDHVVKNILGREDVARDFVRYYLPEEITKDLDLNTLSVSSQSYVSDKLKESLSDLVITLQFKNRGPAEIYILIEHKGGLKYWTRLQLFKYMNEKWQKTGKESSHELPIIIPVVFYHGQEKWKYSLEFADLFNPPDEHYRKYIPKFEHILHEVPEINKRQVKSTIILEVFHLVLEYIFYPEKRDKIYESFELLFQGLDSEDAGEIFAVLIKYLLSATDEKPERAEEKVKHLPKGGETVRTTAEVLEEKGYQEALKEKDKWIKEAEQRSKINTLQDVILENLIERFDVVGPSLTDKIKSIDTLETLNALFRKTNRVNSLEEFSKLVDKALGNA